MKFKILWGIDAVIALVFVYFFVVGLGDGSVSSFNMRLWLSTLFTLGGVALGQPRASTIRSHAFGNFPSNDPGCSWHTCRLVLLGDDYHQSAMELNPDSGLPPVALSRVMMYR